MSQFRLARLCLMLAAFGAAPALMNTAYAQKDEKAAAEQKGPSVRQEVFKLIDPAAVKPLMDAKNWTEIQNRITQAEAIPNLTPYETYVINRMKISLAVSTGKDIEALPVLEQVINSGFLSPQEKDNFLMSVGNMYYNAKNYPKAIEAFKRYQKEGSDPAKVQGALIRAYYLSGDYAAAKNELLPFIAAVEKSGKTPSEEDLRLLASSANKVKDDAGYLTAIEKLAVHYPSDDFWMDLLARGVAHKPGYNAQDFHIDLLRVMFQAVDKMDPEQYVELAELALQGGFPTEAKKVVDAGFAVGALNAGKHKALRDKANKGAADDAKNIASGEASAAKAKTGAGLVNLGWAYVTMDQVDKGIGFIEQGIAKGGLKHPDEAKLRLGMAYAKAGKKDEATKAFESVKAGGGLSDLAKYSILLLNRAK